MRGKTIRRIESYYVQSLWTRLSRFNKKSVGTLFDEVTETGRRRFREAAHDVARCGATPRDWVVAQFDAFDVASEHARRILLPRPGHLVGENAERRWRALVSGDRPTISKGEAISRMRHSAPGGEPAFEPEKQVKEWFRDTRKLEGMARLLRISHEEVLRRYPSEFSAAFARQVSAA